MIVFVPNRFRESLDIGAWRRAGIDVYVEDLRCWSDVPETKTFRRLVREEKPIGVYFATAGHPVLILLSPDGHVTGAVPSQTSYLRVRPFGGCPPRRKNDEDSTGTAAGRIG